MHSVKFLKHWNKYNPGEVAGFKEDDRELLERLVQAGIIGPTDEDIEKMKQMQAAGEDEAASPTSLQESADSVDSRAEGEAKPDAEASPSAGKPSKKA
ncbi:hypothetical protein BUE93_09480 [Chromobacterium amazonense]|uniref:Uncharacterized protein n=1 Tax=Chromobacterium amazonense TaxID=1382803 RepID=A0A2S9X575_9NEIS|nr:hypothetical protein [Chromobacterium amazonense]PRP70881.1 hypothetical protein BUE93_09480 [Chromobacterium amazonense]